MRGASINDSPPHQTQELGNTCKPSADTSAHACMRAALILFVRPRGTPYTHNASPHQFENLDEGSPHTERKPSGHPVKSHIYI